MTAGVFSEALEMYAKGEECALVNIVRADANPELQRQKLLYGKDGLRWGRCIVLYEDKIGAQVHESWGKNKLVRIKDDNNCYLECFLYSLGAAPRLIILGGGHIGAALVHVAAVLDYEIIVVDDRLSFASQQLHPHANRVICNSFDNALETLSLKPADHVAIVTRGHRYDLLCLEKLFDLEKKTGEKVAYLGLIGSRRRVRALLEKLAADGFPREELVRIYTPIGIDIGAETEGEIAISILAEITKIRKKESIFSHKQTEVLKDLAYLEQRGGDAVLVTIVNTVGSTPRKTGTQMLVYPDGRITGTIGGGCGEAEVKREALNVMDLGCCKTYSLDMSGDLAEEEGMVCGGRMDLFLESLNRQACMK